MPDHPLPPNNFDLLRLAAALLVLFSHAFVIAGQPDQEPIAPLLRHAADGGAAAVGAFFVLSGYLIARSAQRHGWRAYLGARARRIYPAFAALILLQTLALGPLLSTLGPVPYLASPETWWSLARALALSPRPGLPGVFEANPLPGVVNGSLWTLRIEVLCYAATLAWAALGAPAWLAAAALALSAAALAAAHAMHAPLQLLAILDCLAFYSTGVALWCWRRIPLRWWIAASLLALFAAGAGTPAAPLLWHAALPYAVLRAGLSTPILAIPMRHLGDISYGAYLYAFPISQLVAQALPGLGPYPLAALVLPPTLLCAYASSRLIERPFRPRSRP